MWSYNVTDEVVEIWRKDSAKISCKRKEPQDTLTWLYDIAALNTHDITDLNELRSFVNMIREVSERLVPP